MKLCLLCAQFHLDEADGIGGGEYCEPAAFRCHKLHFSESCDWLGTDSLRALMAKAETCEDYRYHKEAKMAENEKPKLCPFCAEPSSVALGPLMARVVLRAGTKKESVRFQVECANCHCKGPSWVAGHPEKEDEARANALAQWNGLPRLG